MTMMIIMLKTSHRAQKLQDTYYFIIKLNDIYQYNVHQLELELHNIEFSKKKK